MVIKAKPVAYRSSRIRIGRLSRSVGRRYGEDAFHRDAADVRGGSAKSSGTSSMASPPRECPMSPTLEKSI